MWLIVNAFILLLGYCCTQEVDITSGAAPADKPWVPAWGWYGESRKLEWKETHEKLVRNTVENATRINIVFLGDSITRRWSENGKEIWDNHYAKLGAYNYGMGSDTTRQILWRIDHGELDSLSPAAVVLMIGTNNVGTNDTGDEIAQAIKAIVDRIRDKLPYTRILLLAILPRSDHWLTSQLQEINYSLEKLHDNDHVYYLDMCLDFESTPGFIKNELFLDGLHLNEAGYQQWYNSMNPLLNHLIDPLTEGDISHSPPTWDKPWVPAYGWWGATHIWRFVHENLVHQSLEIKDKAKAIFVGDSITMNWAEAGLEVWNQYYANRSTYNYGMGADSTRQVLWRLAHGEFEELQPKLVVLMIGTNNLYTDFNGNSTDGEIATAISIIIEKFVAKWSHVKILLLGIIPRSEYFMPRIESINSLIAKFANDSNVYFMNMNSHFLNANNTMDTKLYLEDTVHLNKAGYQVWHDTMEPLFKKLLDG